MSQVKEIVGLFNKSGLFEVVTDKSDNEIISVIGRVKDKAKWLQCVEGILLASSKEGCTWIPKVSQIYMIKEKRLVFGWGVDILYDEDSMSEFKEQLERLLGIGLSSTDVKLKESGEVVMAGSPKKRGLPSGGDQTKGAYLVGKLPI